MALDEMDWFYGCGESFLLSLSRERFWGKYRNMQIVRLQSKMDDIHTFNTAQSSEGQSEVIKLNWRLEQLKGEEKVDGLKDLKRKQPKKKKKKKKR